MSQKCGRYSPCKVVLLDEEGKVFTAHCLSSSGYHLSSFYHGDR